MNRVRTTFGEVEIGGKYFLDSTGSVEYVKYRNWYGASSTASPISPMIDESEVWVEKEVGNIPDLLRLPTLEEVRQSHPIVQRWFVYLCNRVEELQDENISLLRDKVDLLRRLLDEKGSGHG